MKQSLLELVNRKRLIVLVGEGGVGKTSSAAALAVLGAMHGRRVGVLTVDPAPRLGEALGIDDIKDAAQAVELGEGVVGSLHALRLDTKSTFDRLVTSLAADGEAAQNLLSNPVYQQVAGSLGGSEHYMAFQRLYELIEEQRFDLIVVDTAPAADSAELLSAPTRLTDLMETGAVSILAEPAKLLLRFGSRVARASMQLALTVIERVAGAEVQGQISGFVAAFSDVLEGLETRSRHVDELLRRQSTAFVVTSRPTDDGTAHTLEFARSLDERGYGLGAVLVGPLTPKPDKPGPLKRTDFESAPVRTFEAASAATVDLKLLRKGEQAAVSALQQRLDTQGTMVAPIPAIEGGIASIDDVIRLARSLA